MKKPYTSFTRVGSGAADEMKKYISENFTGRRGVCVCDENTRRYMPQTPSITDYITYPGDVCAEDTIGDELCTTVRAMKSTGSDIGFLVACGSGSVHDLTRYAAYKLSLPFISFPTAASVDGFVSNVAAMTVGGRKETTPALPPVALFADPDIYRSAPRRLTISGAGDIIGKYISLCDWRISRAITGEEIDEEIMALTVGAVNEVMSLDPSSDSFTDAVMDGLIKSGMAIQYQGSSRPASGAEHHLSHLWEMHCINAPTDALHGEKVGVGTLLVLEEYKRAAQTDFVARFRGVDYSDRHLRPVFGSRTDGIIAENTPNPTVCIIPEMLAAAEQAIRADIATLPQVSVMRDYMRSIGAKTTLAELDLPADEQFRRDSLAFAPYVRRRLTFLKLIGGMTDL